MYINSFVRSAPLRVGMRRSSQDYASRRLQIAANIPRAPLDARGWHAGVISRFATQRLVANPGDLAPRDGDVRRRGRQGGSRVVPSCRRALVEHTPSCPLHGLHRAAFARAVQHFQLRYDDLLDERVRLGGEQVAMRVLLEDLDARPMHQKRIVQNDEVVVEDAERVTLWANDRKKRRICVVQMSIN